MRNLRRLFILVVCLFLLISVNYAASTDNIQTAQPNHPRPVDNLGQPDWYASARAPQTRPDERPAESAPVLTADYGWTKLTYYALRNGNVNVYVADGNETALTHSPATDLMPRLDRGAQNVAFVSDRDGNYEIYTIVVDGTGLTRLTVNPGSDANPTWSPDGSKIAFESYRHDQWDIYIMNRDGSNLVRLTTHEAPDAMPTFSPDGQQIAFMSARTGGYRIWVMNVDGSNKRQLSNQPYSENPTWSPDGSKIGYDADDDLDGFQDLWVMNADGSDQRTLLNPYGETDTYARSWSPDGESIAFTWVDWIDYQGNWYWTDSYLYHRAVSSWDGGQLVDTGFNTEWSPDWQTEDIVPPVTAVQPLPRYVGTDAYWETPTYIDVRSSDAGGSGVRSYDIQTRDGENGEWTDWQNSTPETRHVFDPLPGHTIYFRSRAVDNALNTEPWPSGEGDAMVTFYDWSIEGTIGDVRDVPVRGASVNTNPMAFESWTSDSQGAYKAFLATDQSSAGVDWDRDGYLDLPSTQFATSFADVDATMDVTLPPANNQLQDWGFESDQLYGWEPTGAFPSVITDSYRHTGDQSVLLGPPFSMEVPALIAENIYSFGIGPWSTIDRSGNLHVVWRSSSELYYAQKPRGGNWGAPVRLDGNPGSIVDLVLAAGDDGAIHVLYRTYEQISHVRRDAGGTWSAAQPLVNEGNPIEFQFAVDGSGVGHFIWSGREGGQGFSIYRNVDGDGNWSAPYAIGEYRTRQLQIGPRGHLHILGEYAISNVYYISRSPQGNWTNWTEICDDCDKHQLIVDADSNAHFLFSQDTFHWPDDLYYKVLNHGGAWSAERQVPGLPGSKAAVDTDGTLHLISVLYNRIYYSYLDDSGQWSELVAINMPYNLHKRPIHRIGNELYFSMHSHRYEDGPRDLCYLHLAGPDTGPPVWCARSPAVDIDTVPDMLVDPEGFLHALWIDGDKRTLEHASSLPAPTTGSAGIQHAVTVPMTMTNPTLSFYHAMGPVTPENSAHFDVTFSDDVTETHVFTSTAGSAWQHQWIDMSPWQGRAVTITFTMDQETATLRSWVALDEATLGSAYPDIWIRGQKRTDALPGEQMSLSVDYGNRSTALAAGNRLTVALPEGLAFDGATIPPIDVGPELSWNVEDLTVNGGPLTLIITATVDPALEVGDMLVASAHLASNTPELELLNNFHALNIRIGREIALPTILSVSSRQIDR
ncbi:MAG: hypothetical protein R3248_02075 [Candidatus Promineifilaceae bacterium]|nr:hypothetical protein [Candidatus Promineifilaceae bacterium]